MGQDALAVGREDGLDDVDVLLGRAGHVHFHGGGLPGLLGFLHHVEAGKADVRLDLLVGLGQPGGQKAQGQRPGEQGPQFLSPPGQGIHITVAGQRHDGRIPGNGPGAFRVGGQFQCQGVSQVQALRLHRYRAQPLQALQGHQFGQEDAGGEHQQEGADGNQARPLQAETAAARFLAAPPLAGPKFPCSCHAETLPWCLSVITVSMIGDCRICVDVRPAGRGNRSPVLTHGGGGSAMFWNQYNGKCHGKPAVTSGNQARPVWPKPPSARRLVSNASTSSKRACTTGTNTSWAMRSPGSMVKRSRPRFQQETNNWPW